MQEDSLTIHVLGSHKQFFFSKEHCQRMVPKGSTPITYPLVAELPPHYAHMSDEELSRRDRYFRSKEELLHYCTAVRGMTEIPNPDPSMQA